MIHPPRNGRVEFHDRVLPAVIHVASLETRPHVSGGAACHSPVNGFGDSQSIAIGIDNNLVGPHREGPRNMRRTPMVLNTAFYPKLMWNSRFTVPSTAPSPDCP